MDFGPVFITNRRFSVKVKLIPLGFESNSIFFKTAKILCTTLKHLNEIEHEPPGVEIHIFCQFSSPIDDFW
jgi:hypothetical protein